MEQRKHSFLGTIMQAEVMQDTCEGLKEAVVTEDGVSISITGRHHHQSNTDKKKDKKEGQADTKRHTQQANKQDYQNDFGSTQQTDTWVATDSYPPPILQPIRPARFLAFLIVFFPYFFLLSVSFVVCLSVFCC